MNAACVISVLSLTLLAFNVGAQVDPGWQPIGGIPSPVKRIQPEHDGAWVIVTRNGEFHRSTTMSGHYKWLNPNSADSIHRVDGVIRDSAGRPNGSFRLSSDKSRLQLTSKSGDIEWINLPSTDPSILTIGCVYSSHDTLIVGPSKPDAGSSDYINVPGVLVTTDKGTSWVELPALRPGEKEANLKIQNIFRGPNGAIIVYANDDYVQPSTISRYLPNATTWEHLSTDVWGVAQSNRKLYFYNFFGVNVVDLDSFSLKKILNKQPLSVFAVRVQNFDTVVVYTGDGNHVEVCKYTMSVNDVLVNSVDTLYKSYPKFTADYNDGQISMVVGAFPEGIVLHDARLQPFGAITVETPTYNALEMASSADGVTLETENGYFNYQNGRTSPDANLNRGNVDKLIDFSDEESLIVHEWKWYLLRNGNSMDTVSVTIKDQNDDEYGIVSICRRDDTVYASVQELGMVSFHISTPDTLTYHNVGYPLEPDDRKDSVFHRYGAVNLYPYGKNIFAVLGRSSTGIWKYSNGEWVASAKLPLSYYLRIDASRVGTRLALRSYYTLRENNRDIYNQQFYLYDLATETLTTPQQPSRLGGEGYPMTLLPSNEIVSVKYEPPDTYHVVAYGGPDTVRRILTIKYRPTLHVFNDTLFMGTYKWGFVKVDWRKTVDVEEDANQGNSESQIVKPIYHSISTGPLKIQFQTPLDVLSCTAMSIQGRRFLVQSSGEYLDVGRFASGWYAVELKTTNSTIRFSLLLSE